MKNNIKSNIRLNRSELAVPGIRKDFFEKAAKCKSDIVFLDLEDSVSVGDKINARKNVIQAINEIDWKNKTLSVRVNSFETSFLEKDIEDIINVLNCKDAEIRLADDSENFSEETEFLSASYSYNCQITPVYVSGDTEPVRIYFGRKSSSMNIKISKDKGNLDYNGLKGAFSVVLNDKNNTKITSVICKGTIQSKSIQASSGQKVNYDLNLISYSSPAEVIVNSITPQ